MHVAAGLAGCHPLVSSWLARLVGGALKPIGHATCSLVSCSVRLIVRGNNERTNYGSYEGNT
jgi:hypothetical protein